MATASVSHVILPNSRHCTTVATDQWFGLRPSVLGQDRSETKKNRSWSWSCRSRVLLRNTGLVTLVEHNDLEGHSNVSSTIDFFNSLSILCLDHHYCGDQQWRLKVKSAKCYCLLLVVLVVHNAAVLVLRIWSCLHHCYYHYYYYYYYYSNDTTNNNMLSMRPPQYDPAPASGNWQAFPFRRYGRLSVTVLSGLMTLTFDLLTLHTYIQMIYNARNVKQNDWIWDN